MSKPGKAVYPNKDDGEKALLKAKYKVFLRQCQEQRQYRKEIDDAITGWKR